KLVARALRERRSLRRTKRGEAEEWRAGKLARECGDAPRLLVRAADVDQRGVDEVFLERQLEIVARARENHARAPARERCPNKRTRTFALRIDDDGGCAASVAAGCSAGRGGSRLNVHGLTTGSSGSRVGRPSMN